MGEDEKRRDSDNESITSSSSKGSSQAPEKIPYPKSVFFILSTEACERFSYYGMRAILSLYLKNLFISTSNMEIKAAEDLSTILYHAFIFLSYFTALFGALLADSFLGKFRTVFYISILYAIGQLLLSAGAVPNSAWGLPQQAMSFIGLVIIAFGTGGIKPCVVSFGADQFKLPEQRSEMSSFFGIFYASINLGSMISTILTPIFRKQPCFGEDECFSLAFLVPAILMAVAIVFFVMGRPGYKVIIPDFNVVADFCKCIGEGISKKGKGPKRDHYLDYAEPRFGKRFVADVKAVLRICIIFCCYPVFWALYDQQGSRWTFQATRMDGKLGSVQILPDQIQVINAFLIIVFIPIFDRGVYPLCNKARLLRTPLQKIVVGGCLLALSFVASAILELILEQTYPHPPSNKFSRLAYHNGLSDNCMLEVKADQLSWPIADGKMFDEEFLNDDDFYTNTQTIFGGQTGVLWNDDKKAKQLIPIQFPKYKKKEDYRPSFEFKLTATAKNVAGKVCSVAGDTSTVELTIVPEMSKTIFFHKNKDNKLDYYTPENDDFVDKSASGFPYMRVIYNLDQTGDLGDDFLVGKTKLQLKEWTGKQRDQKVGIRIPLNYTINDGVGEDNLEEEGSRQGVMKMCVTKKTEDRKDDTDYHEYDLKCVKSENINVYDIADGRPTNDGTRKELVDMVTRGMEFENDEDEKEDEELQYGTYTFKYGGAYNLYLQQNEDDNELRLDIIIVTPPNSIHMLWLLPQYVILTAGEVLFSITSLAFAFTQAPESMKAVVQALYLLTNAVGNLIDIAIVAIFANAFNSQAWEFLIFAGLMFVDMAILAWVATNYTYVDYTNGSIKYDDEDDEDDEKDRKSITSDRPSKHPEDKEA